MAEVAREEKLRFTKNRKLRFVHFAGRRGKNPNRMSRN